MAHQNWNGKLQVGSSSDVGMRRANNQDSFAISMASTMERWRQRGHLFLVADGMGAHAAGELASKMAVDDIPRLYHKYDQLPPAEALHRAVNESNAEIYRKGQANEDFFNMGTTCSMLAILPQGAIVAHVGDSRVYRLRSNIIEQLTFDHSLVWEMRASRSSADDSSWGHVPKNVITRSLGPYPQVKVDLEGPFAIQRDDVFLLCSDGLTGQVSDLEIGSILANLSPEEAVKALVDLANLRGGPDNITVIVVKVVSDEMTTAFASGNGRSRLTSKAMARAGKAVESSAAKFEELPTVGWVLAIVSLLATILIGFLAQNITLTIIAAIVTITIFAGLLLTIAGRLRLANQADIPMLGRGPYTRNNCAAGSELINQLDQIARQLHDFARSETWPIDVHELEKRIFKAQEASKDHRYQEAVRLYARIISFVMDRIRAAGKSKDPNRWPGDPLESD